MSILAQEKNEIINDLKTARESKPNRVLINYNQPPDC